MELFRARAYTIELAGRLSPESTEMLQRDFELMEISPDTHRTTIEIELLQNGRLYELIDGLRQSGLMIESIGRRLHL